MPPFKDIGGADGRINFAFRGANMLSDEWSQIYGQVAKECPATVWS